MLSIQQGADEKLFPLLLPVNLKQHLANDLTIPQATLTPGHTNQRKSQLVTQVHQPLVDLRDDDTYIIQHQSH